MANSMSDAPSALIARLTDNAQWLRILEKCRQYDVEEDSGDEYVYDVRDDYILYWGRDGWEAGIWHAKMYLVEEPGHWLLMAEQNTAPSAAPILGVAKRIRAFLEECLGAREVPTLTETQDVDP